MKKAPLWGWSAGKGKVLLKGGGGSREKDGFRVRYFCIFF
jgi:hypothetical protein